MNILFNMIVVIDRSIINVSSGNSSSIVVSVSNSSIVVYNIIYSRIIIIV